MAKKKNVPQNKIDQQANIFGQVSLFSGCAALLAAFWFNSIVPIIIVGVGLLCTLGFINGFSA